MKHLVFLFLFSSALFSLTSGASAHGPHEHGVILGNVLVEEGEVSITLDSPLANFLHFERRPVSRDERQAVRAMAKKMRQPQSLFLFSEKAECTIKRVDLSSPVIDGHLLSGGSQGGTPRNQDRHDEHHNDGAHDGHANIEIALAFGCRHPGHLSELSTVVFHSFPAVHTVSLQMILPVGQMSAELTQESNTVRW